MGDPLAGAVERVYRAMRGEKALMLAHELLRAAALIVEAGWASSCDAQEEAGIKVPLFAGASR